MQRAPKNMARPLYIISGGDRQEYVFLDALTSQTILDDTKRRKIDIDVYDRQTTQITRIYKRGYPTQRPSGALIPNAKTVDEFQDDLNKRQEQFDDVNAAMGDLIRTYENPRDGLRVIVQILCGKASTYCETLEDRATLIQELADGLDLAQVETGSHLLKEVQRRVRSLNQNSLPKSFAEAQTLVPGLMKFEEAKKDAERNPDHFRSDPAKNFSIVDHLRDPINGWGRFTLSESGLPRSVLEEADPQAYRAVYNWQTQNKSKLPADIRLPRKTDVLKDMAQSVDVGERRMIRRAMAVLQAHKLPSSRSQ